MEPLQQMLHYISSGLFVAIFMLWIIPNFAWAKLARVPGFSPNWVTLWGIPITATGFAVYFWVDSYQGFLITVVGLVLDRIDGKMAKLHPPLQRTGSPAETMQDHWRYFRKELNHPGTTETGKWLDPLADKFKTPPFIVAMGLMGYFSIPLVLGIVVLAIVSTIMRPPFQLVPNRYLRGKAATGFGKLKITAEFISMILVLPLHQEWMKFPQWYLNALLGVALVFGVLSILSRLQFKNQLANGVVDGVSEAFRHE